MKKKLYISLPISGHDIEEVKHRAALAKKHYSEKYDVITPFDICTDEAATYANCMGKDIEALLECDVIFLMTGWQKSKGCMAEFYVAQVYNKQILM